jgi:methyltransferase (TIGR00027 family)
MKSNLSKASNVRETKPQFNILEKLKEEYDVAEFLRESIARDGITVPATGPTALPMSPRGRAIEIEEAEGNSRRIETKTSKTAIRTCIARAASFYENRSQYRSGDHIAPLLLPRFVCALIKMKPIRNLIIRQIPKGLYEYTIARTKYIDSVFENSIKDGFQQVVILGAGFDSRGIRFCRANTAVKIFELDVPITQNDKIQRLRKRRMDINKNVIFVPIDFDKESTADALARSGFEKGKKTLFLMEGVLPLLTLKAVESIFGFLKSSSGNGSEAVFDYVHKSVLHKENRYYGEKEVYNYVRKVGEPIVSGMDYQELESFLFRFQFSIRENMDSDALNKMYFSEENAKRPGVVNETLCIVRARKT